MNIYIAIGVGLVLDLLLAWLFRGAVLVVASLAGKRTWMAKHDLGVLAAALALLFALATAAGLILGRMF